MKILLALQEKRPFLSWFIGWLRPFYWFYWQPDGWYTWRRQLGLPESFTIMQLKQRHWQQSQMQKFLVDSYVIGPLVATILITPWLVTEWFWTGISFGLVMGLFVALGFAILLSVAAGAIAAPCATAVFVLILGQQNTILADLLWQPRLGFALGISSAVAISILISPTSPNIGYTKIRQAGSIFFGIIISAGVMGLAAGVSAFIASYWQQGYLNTFTTVLIFGVSPIGVFAAAAALNSRSWRRGILGGFLQVCLVIVLTAFFFRNINFNQEIYGASLLHLNIVLVTTSYLMLISIPFAFARRFGGIWAGRVAAAIGSLALHIAYKSIYSWYDFWLNFWVHLLIILLALTIHLWRPLLVYPFQLAWSLLLPRWESHRQYAEHSLFSWQACFWDVYQFLPLVGVLDHLLLISESYPIELDGALTAVANSRQHQLARRAQIELDARRLANPPDLSTIANIHPYLSTSLPIDPAGALLRSFRHVSIDVAAAINQRSTYNQRLALSVTVDRLNSLIRELTRTPDLYAHRFRSIAQQWHNIINKEVEKLTREAIIHQEIEDPYIIGIPLPARQEIFVGREAVVRRIEQLLTDKNPPPLLIYGQRRMGKTSLLNNLGRLLPRHITPLFIDLQGPIAAAKNHAGLLYNLSRAMQRSAMEQRNIILPALTRAEIELDPFTNFDVWLDQVENEILSDDLSQLLIMLDEFEALDQALVTNQFSENHILGMLRHIIQHRKRFRILLSGSHTLNEYRRWSGYLLNAQVLHLKSLEKDEAIQLITQPIPHFRLNYNDTAIQAVLNLTNGHPYLLQLLCSEIIARKNEQETVQRFAVTTSDVTASIQSALDRGSLFFADIELNQLPSDATTLLKAISKKKITAASLATTQAQLGLKSRSMLEDLLKREVLKKNHGEIRFHNELLRHWFMNENK